MNKCTFIFDIFLSYFFIKIKLNFFYYCFYTHFRKYYKLKQKKIKNKIERMSTAQQTTDYKQVPSSDRQSIL